MYNKGLSGRVSDKWLRVHPMREDKHHHFERGEDVRHPLYGYLLKILITKLILIGFNIDTYFFGK